ncbi:MAG: response regulator transcription factor, partial [Anaerolineales bacterium]|nr:response regulator transcription factor [Anaerolineales bacterium]
MIKVLICDDQAIVCEGRSRILGMDTGIEVVGMAYNGADALAQIPEAQPDLVLMDLKMPVMNGVVASRKIKEKYPHIQVLVLTTYDDDEWIFDAIRGGAAGYLLKDTPPQELITAIKGTVEGKSYIDPSIGAKVLTKVAVEKKPEKLLTTFSLSDREYEVLNLLAQGLTNADIAQTLFLTEGTVRNYTSEIFKKLGVSDRTLAAIVALRHGLVDI